MMMKKNNDTFLADWLAGHLTDDDLRAKVSAEDFQAYRKLKDSLAALELPAPDMDANFASVKAKKAAALDQKHRPKVVRLYAYIAAAASVLLLVGLYNFFIFSNTAAASFGEARDLALTDYSHVRLNAKSSVSYPNLFAMNRNLTLDGEAYFEVTKGQRFTVETSQGSVTVLGTKFNVLVRDGVFEVTCFEGKVQVCHENQIVVLTPGNAIRFYDGASESWQTDAAKPGWAQQESSFRNMPLVAVLSALENQYGVKIDCPESAKNTRFTGTFTHRNLDTALQSVCVPMQLKPSKVNGKIILSE